MTPFQTYACMVLCARDVDIIWGQLPQQEGNPELPQAAGTDFAYLTQKYWEPIAQLRCDDLIISKGLNCYYGLVLRCVEAVGPFEQGDFLCAVRGTMDPVEWLNDALAEVPLSVPNVIGQVGFGFRTIYDSMTLNRLDGTLIGDNVAVALAARIRSSAQNAPAKLHVVGHSLGAALATYLTADLETALKGSKISLEPYFFASPRTGTYDFVSNYRSSVGTYTLVNFAGDLVPNLPFLPPFQTLMGGGPTHDVHVIPLDDPNAPPLSPQNNHSPVSYARMLDPGNHAAQVLPL